MAGRRRGSEMVCRVQCWPRSRVKTTGAVQGTCDGDGARPRVHEVVEGLGSLSSPLSTGLYPRCQWICLVVFTDHASILFFFSYNLLQFSLLNLR